MVAITTVSKIKKVSVIRGSLEERYYCIYIFKKIIIISYVVLNLNICLYYQYSRIIHVSLIKWVDVTSFYEQSHFGIC